ncbi:MAG TPA: class I SAM-dependent methyltransferase [Crenalkalicoccus sp.]|nr:class I SAM-dependent methyltransferase [Crenalkalicoccus sp.]
MIERAIAALVPGRSFADLGGLWGLENERVSTALLAGAREATMVDAIPRDHLLWAELAARCAARGVAAPRMVQADILDPGLPGAVGLFDVVHCSGVIYHCPDPYHALRQMMAVARRHLLLGSATVPARIENAAGVLELGEGRVIAVPALRGAARAVLARHFAEAGIAVHNLTTTEAHPWTWPGGAFNTAPWWWLWTAETLAAMAETAGLRVREVFGAWEGRAHYLVCEVPA